MAVPRKIGFYSLTRTARALCKFIYIFTPAIQKAYPGSTALLTALELANEACHELEKQIQLTAEPGT